MLSLTSGRVCWPNWMGNDMTDCITQNSDYGQQIPLTCRSHPNLRWSTKNISPIGSRRIFYNLFSDPDMGQECSCPMSDLVPVVE